MGPKVFPAAKFHTTFAPRHARETCAQTWKRTEQQPTWGLSWRRAYSRSLCRFQNSQSDGLWEGRRRRSQRTSRQTQMRLLKIQAQYKVCNARTTREFQIILTFCTSCPTTPGCSRFKCHSRINTPRQRYQRCHRPTPAKLQLRDPQMHTSHTHIRRKVNSIAISRRATSIRYNDI